MAPLGGSERPGNTAVKNRRGQIWGKLVPYGLTDLGFGLRTPAPRRAGANENIVFAVSHPVTINGQPLPVGRYGLHMIADPTEWTLIFSNNSTAWGSFFYQPSEDALRITVKPSKHDFREYLTYEFPVRKPTEAVAEMRWEDLAVAWTIAVPNVNKVYLSKIRGELQNVPGFNCAAYVPAIQFCLDTNSNLPEALRWAEIATTASFVGQPNFATLSVKAEVLKRLGRIEESKTTRLAALNHPSASAPQVHQYGRQPLADKQPAEALAVFELNHKRHGDIWPVHLGLARAHAALGNKAKALDHAKIALPQAPDPLNKKGVEDLIASVQ